MSEPTPEALMFARIWLANDPSKKGEDELAGVLDRFAAAAVERERERCLQVVRDLYIDPGIRNAAIRRIHGVEP